MTDRDRGGHQAKVVRTAIDFRATYRANFSFVWTNLLRLGVGRIAIDDAVQDVFLVVHRRLPTFEGRAALRTWLFSIVRRVAAQHRRAHFRTSRRVRALTAEVRPEVDDSIHRRELGWVLIEALSDLDEKQRSAVVLHTLADLSGPEVAATLGIKLDTAYSRIKAGRRELQRALRRRGVTASADLLRGARASTSPEMGDRRRVAAGLLVKLGGSTALAVPAIPTAMLGKVALAISGAAAAATLALATPAASAPDVGGPVPRRVRTLEPTSTAQANAAVSRSTEPTIASATREPRRGAPPPRVKARRSPARRPSPPVAATDPVLAEIRLLEEVRNALRRDRPAHALQLLDTFESQPSSQLAPERTAYRAITLCRLGQHAAGRAAARRASRVSATLAGTIEASCPTYNAQTDPGSAGHQGKHATPTNASARNLFTPPASDRSAARALQPVRLRPRLPRRR